MMSALDFLNQYGMPIVVVGQVVLAGTLLYLRDKFAPKDIEKTIWKLNNLKAVEISDLDKRTTILEQTVKDVPSKSDLHQLEKEICDLRGDLKRVDENLDGTEGFITRLECQVNRMEDFLKGGRK